LKLCCSEKYRIGIIRWFTNVSKYVAKRIEDGVKVEIMKIQAHVGLEGNEIVDKRARHAALIGAVFERQLPPVDYQGLPRSVRPLYTPEFFCSTLV
jgi:hypothetical protein